MSDVATGTKKKASDSICPRGWEIPTTSQFDALSVPYGFYGSSTQQSVNNIKKYPLNFNHAWMYNVQGDAYWGNGTGQYWTSETKADVGTSAHDLIFDNRPLILTKDSTGKNTGALTVRCLKK